MKNSKTIGLLTILALISGILVFFDKQISAADTNLVSSKILSSSKSEITQKVVAEADSLVPQQVLYANNEVVGVVTDLKTIEKMITDVSADKYEKDFPDSKLGFGEDVFIAEEMSTFIYEDVDEDIKDYIVEHDLLAIEVNKVTFSNGAVIYVKELQDFENAKENYMLNFISEKDMEYIKNNEKIPYTDDYGSTTQSLEVVEKTSISRGYASIDKIYKDEREIVEFLSYGYGTDKEYHTVEAFDTVDGVASLSGISPQQLMTINPHIKSREQLIKEGDKLNVTFFESPINVVVKKRTVKQEVVYPDSTLYVQDPTLSEGKTVTTVNEEMGSKKVAYEETYVNGALKDGSTVLETKILKEPVQEVIKRGTMIMPRIGSGRFRFPVDNAIVSCGWYCYAGHTATDVQNAVNRYGPVRAADRGVVEVASYHGINGYYVWINHNNGYKTYYGHMNTSPYVSPGTIVSKGDIIGQIGMSGYATGPHVHFMVTYNGTYINPMTVIGG